jgi:two-component system chemotaxis response regulator CheY
VEHALVVDDSRAVRKLLARTLEGLGYKVTQAEHGKAALELLRAAEPVSLILTDWNMPEMNGFEFLTEVRRQKALDAVPVIMITTETEMEHMAMALEAGANEYVMKPFTTQILTDKIRMVGARV